MNYEKKYKDALERAREQYNKRTPLYDIESIFPELKDSEERIRQALISILKSDFEKETTIFGISVEEIIDWLEKQGEKKHIINVPPREVILSIWELGNEWKELTNGSISTEYGTQLEYIQKHWHESEYYLKEKQGNKIVDCQQNHQDVKHSNGEIVMEDFNGGEGFYKLHLDYLSKKQVEEVEEMVRMWNKESKAFNENIKNCVEMCLTDANEQRFEDFGTTLKDCIVWLEKQCEQKSTAFSPKFCLGDKLVSTKNPRLTYEVLEVGHINELGNLEYKLEIFTDGKAENPHNIHYMECCKVDEWAKLIEQKPVDKVEPKFKVGDFITNDYCLGKVIEITNDAYLLDTGQGIPFSCEHNAHLWTIEDAKDGDVLINWNNTTFIFRAIEDETVKFHIAYNEKWDTIKTSSTKLSHLGLPEPQFEFHPATKEQCDLLYSKMREVGYEWDSEKKELKKIEVASKESEDERVRKGLIKAVSRIFEGHKLYGTDVTREEALAWLEKQGEKKPNSQMAKCSKCQFVYTGYCNGTCILENNEQKSADNVEPKFKAGDWITNGRYTRLVVGVDSRHYQFENGDAKYIDDIDKKYHLWTIADAKDGDVLVDEDINVIGIFEGIAGMCWHSKIYYSNTTKELYGTECGGSHQKEFAKPATKEQSDLLFSKIKQAGYEWDSEKKELKKIEPKKLDADKVIAWLVANICDFEYYVKLFKKDFGLC